MVLILRVHSPACQPCQLVCISLSTAPSAPRNLMAIQINPFNVTLEWSVPKDKNGIIRHYILRYYELSAPNDTVVNITTTETTLTVEGLSAFTDYVFRVSAVTVEEGPFTEISIKTAQSSKYVHAVL